ncbi:pyridoxamine 5'-phosphate oxidase family protein [Nocardioides sp.]|uniref:pyridoxamine 5'-phosphate oxidase family protein n=1 Tax=Nocardioides sp. TaxID=35761 RepID=UPI002733B4CC|nr:pyridoxamine 5'-phosphate oxidase family protein [Nocardioides sp.]MDP3890633.1 pyridoxamine 5'-phosphate oxidase family protein [Nocardioides sp.]
MTGHYAQLAFTPLVTRHQATHGSAGAYARMAESGDAPDRIGPDEAAFIESRDSFFIATVSETGWPYVQHRGGPPGFLQVVDDTTLGFADFRGNRQYITRGNLDHDPRVSLFLVDYQLQARMKILGRARVVEPEREPGMLSRLTPPDYAARIERAVLIEVEAFDWNCRQHIPAMVPLHTVQHTISELAGRIADLEAELAEAKGAPGLSERRAGQVGREWGPQ